MPYFDSIGEPAGYDYDVSATEQDYSVGMGAVMPPGMMGGMGPEMAPGMPPGMGGGMGPLGAGDFPGGGMPGPMMDPMGGQGMMPPMGGGGMMDPMGMPPPPPEMGAMPMQPFGPETNGAKETLRQRAMERMAAAERFQAAAAEINGTNI